MKRKALFVVFIVFSIVALANNDLIAIRMELNLAAEDEKVAQTFYNQMSPVNDSSPPILIGFKAISILIMGKHAFNPYTKLKHFYRGKEMLDKAIALETNLELHFLRFAVQTNIPSFLPYTGDIEYDKKYIFLNLGKSKDKDLIKRIILYLSQTKYCSDADLKQILQ